jgi:hypothetical protein
LSGGVLIRKIIQNGNWLIGLTTGVLAAMMLSFSGSDRMTAVGSDYITSRYLLMNASVSSDFFIYLLFCRGIPFFLLLILTTKTDYRTFIMLYLFYCGFSYGTQAVLLTLYEHWNAFLIIIAQLLPQIICYIPALFFACKIPCSDSHKKKQYFFAGFFLWLCGIAAEYMLNPYFLKFSMKILL